jgi:hypothetical protein
MIIPTLCVGMQPLTLCVKFASWNAERPLRHSHAERGNDQLRQVVMLGELAVNQALDHVELKN